VTDEQHDDRDEFRQFVGTHERMVRASLSRSEGNASDVEELCADVFVLAYERFGELSGINVAQQRAWLARAAGFLMANHGRRMATRRRTTDALRALQVQDGMLSAEDEVVPHVEEAVGLALSRLDAAQRQVLVLRALGHDGPSIGRMLGTTAGTARKRLMVARAAFIVAYEQMKATVETGQPCEGSVS
jgi:RNA polymerase sigma factor (sigma-70 family)